MVTLFLRQGETGKQVLLSFPTTTPAEKEDVDRTLETLKSMSKTVTIQGAASEVMNLGLYLSGVDLAAEGELERINQLAENLDQFDFAPDVHSPEELGKYMIQQSGHYEYDENLEDFYNYGDYGVKRILQDDGVFVNRGYVSYHGTLTLDELMQDDPAEKYQQEQEAKMEGMTW